MASHYHHHHCQNPVAAPSTTITTTTSSCSCNQCCFQTHHPSPPPQLQVDPLLQALASLLQQQQQQQQQQSTPYSLYHSKLHTHKKDHQKLHFQEENHHQQNQLLLSSLLQRIDVLESSLHHFSTKRTHFYPSCSLRDAAARIIQTHFRAFLVRRSRTLRQLKDVALIKSSFNTLKSSVSNKTHFDFEAVSNKAVDLLLQLDSIQGGDPMIRDGKMSISRDLVRFLDFIDGFTVKRHGIAYKVAKDRCVGSSSKSRVLNANVGYGDLSRKHGEILGKLRNRAEKIHGFSRGCENEKEDVELEGFEQFIDEEDNENEEENPKVVSTKTRTGISKMRKGVLGQMHEGQPRVKKTVTFDENGNVCRIFEPVLSGDVSTDGSESSNEHGDTKHVVNEKEIHLENGASLQSCEAERNHRAYICLDKDGSLIFSAPRPLKMEKNDSIV